MHDKLSVGDVSDIGYFDVHFKMSNLYAFYSHRVRSTGNIILQSDTDMRDVFFILVTYGKETTNFSAITAIKENQYASEHRILEQYTVETSTWQVAYTLYMGLHYCSVYRATRHPMPIPLGLDLVQLYLQHLRCTKPETFTAKPNTNVVVSRTH